MMTPQAATVLLGLHQVRQSAGRVRSPLLKDSDNNNVYDFDNQNRAGINIHPGEIIKSQRGGMAVERNKLGGLQGAYGASSEDDFNIQLAVSEIFYILSKYGKDRKQSAFSYLEEKAKKGKELKMEERLLRMNINLLLLILKELKSFSRMMR